MSESKDLQPTENPSKGFGSFFSDNVEVLIAMDEYRVPPCPVPLEPVIPDSLKAPSDEKEQSFKELEQVFGSSLKTSEFLLDPRWTFINHGAFGASLRSVLDKSHQWHVHMESQPLRFLDRELLPLLVQATRELADFVGCDRRDLVLVPNATLGLNAVIGSLGLVPSDRVLRLDITYGSVKTMLDLTGATIDEIPVTEPVSADAIVQSVEDALKAQTYQLAVFDYVSSNSALVLPVQRLVKLCNEMKVPVLIDGAHSLGAFDLNLSELNPTFFVANAHKWLCTAKGCAMLYVRSDYRDRVRCPVISHGFTSGFLSSFVWTGLRDYGPLLSLMTALRWWKAVGVQRIRRYCHEMTRWAGAYLAEQWGTELLAPADMFGTMVTVRLPGPKRAKNSNENNEIQDRLHFSYGIECPIKPLFNRLYVRISAHVYNTRQEYERLARAMLEIRPNTPGQDDVPADAPVVDIHCGCDQPAAGAPGAPAGGACAIRRKKQ